MPKTNDGALVTHRDGDCACVRRAFHIVDVEGDLYGLTYDPKISPGMLGRLKRKHPTVELRAVERSIFTIARHVDVDGRMV